MSDYRERVRVEREELDEKLTKLQTFIHSPLFHQLAFEARNQLRRQERFMLGYWAVLTERIETFDD